MKITDEVISDFFGKGKGFVVQSIKRWGGFIKREEDLDAAVFHAIKTIISARDREIEFDDEVHMVNYMMRCCYWGWCDVLNQKKKDLIVIESELIPKDADDDFQPKITEPSCEMPDLKLDGPNSLVGKLTQLVMDRFGPFGVEVFERTIAGEETVREMAKSVGKTPQWIDQKRRMIKIYLSFRVRKYSIQIGYQKPKPGDTICRIQYA